MKLLLIMMVLASTSLFAQEKKISFLTYNVGLAHTFVPLAKERRPHIVEALKNSTADVLCLQEAWTKKDRKKIKKGLREIYPYSHEVFPDRVKTPKAPACKIGNLFGEGKIVSCFQKTCKGMSGDEFTDCVINKCRTPLDNLKEERLGCAQALMAQVGKNQILAILKLLNPLWRPDVFTYKGSVGTMLFSKHPLSNKGFHDLKDMSTLTRRGILYADVESPLGDIHVSCNHLTANLTDTAPYAGIFSGWEEENRLQTETVIRLADSLGAGKPRVVMGDFNSGPELPWADVTGEFVTAHLDFLLSGFLSPIILPGSAGCSFCADNSLNERDETSSLIDHVFLKGFQFDLLTLPSAAVILKDKVNVGKEQTETNLSDHFGVLVEVYAD